MSGGGERQAGEREAQGDAEAASQVGAALECLNSKEASTRKTKQRIVEGRGTTKKLWISI